MEKQKTSMTLPDHFIFPGYPGISNPVEEPVLQWQRCLSIFFFYISGHIRIYQTKAPDTHNLYCLFHPGQVPFSYKFYSYISICTCTCVCAYVYHIKTDLKIWSVSIHAYTYPSSVWIATRSNSDGWRIHLLAWAMAGPH